jgi:hypothetical protein
MTREEFIKIAIAKGCPQEEAVILADILVDTKNTYQQGYYATLSQKVKKFN